MYTQTLAMKCLTIRLLASSNCSLSSILFLRRELAAESEMFTCNKQVCQNILLSKLNLSLKCQEQIKYLSSNGFSNFEVSGTLCCHFPLKH